MVGRPQRWAPDFRRKPVSGDARLARECEPYLVRFAQVEPVGGLSVRLADKIGRNLVGRAVRWAPDFRHVPTRRGPPYLAAGRLVGHVMQLARRGRMRADSLYRKRCAEDCAPYLSPDATQLHNATFIPS